jgi:ABC-type lipoprotein release transport system permease subunit
MLAQSPCRPRPLASWISTASDQHVRPGVLAGAALGMLLVGGCAAWLPARRAARIDPVIALLAE